MGGFVVTPRCSLDSVKDWSGHQRNMQKEYIAREEAKQNTINLSNDEYDVTDSDFSVTEGNWKPYSGWGGWEP